MGAIRFYVQEALLAVLFGGIFMAVSVGAWNEAGGVFFPHTIVGISIIIPLVYLVLLLMIRQHRERRQKLTKKSTNSRDEC